jgi:hypothetical protein
VRLAQWLGTRTPAQLAALLTARPDATLAPAPRHLGELADRLATFHSVAGALQRLPLPAIQLIEVLQLLGPTARRADLAGWLGRPPDDPALAGILTLLGDWALVWPEGERLHAADPLYGAFRYPLRLGPPAATLLARYPADQLRRIARTLGAPLPHRKPDLLAGVVAALSDPDLVRTLVATADTGTRARLHSLAADGPETHDGGVWYGYHRTDPSLRWAIERGLVVTDSLGASQLVREVAVALRGPGWHAPFTPECPEPALAEVDDAAVEREAAAAGSAAVDQVTTLLEAIAAAPVALLKSGGLGVKELRRLARTTGIDEGTTRLWLELAYDAALVTPARDRSGAGQLLPTPEYDGWACLDPAGRLAALLPAWADLPAAPPTESDAKPPPALLRDHVGQFAATIRRRLLALAAGLPAGHGVTDPARLAAALAWHSPLLMSGYAAADQFVRSGWREATLLGVVAHGALSPLGRALAGSGADLTATCRALLPPATEEAVFQADLTAVVPGTPARALAQLLDAAADRESRGGAMTWRFSAGSVRRALDIGYEPTELLDSLRRHAVGRALPQPLSYLVGDVARRHGAVRVRAVACVLRVADPALAAELTGARALRSLRLSVIAPSVLGSAGPVAETLAVLRAAGYAPVAESADGAVELERIERRRASRPKPARRAARPAPVEPVDPRALADRLLATPVPAPAPMPQPRDPELSDGFGPELNVEAALEELADQLAPGERRLLAHAIETADPVLIGYTNAQGNHSTRVIDSAELDGHLLVAWCHLRDDERAFALNRIDSVAPVP